MSPCSKPFPAPKACRPKPAPKYSSAAATASPDASPSTPCAADPDMNVRLSGGEEIRVPEASKIYVVGSVKRPGAFPLRDAADTSVLKLLALAEGLAPYSGK